MANNAIDLQQQVKHNAEDFQNYLKNLYKFEEDIKVKDEALRKKTPTKSPPDYVSSHLISYNQNYYNYIYVLISKLGNPDT